jgi:hypothetical protein
MRSLGRCARCVSRGFGEICIALLPLNPAVVLGGAADGWHAVSTSFAAAFVCMLRRR